MKATPLLVGLGFVALSAWGQVRVQAGGTSVVIGEGGGVNVQTPEAGRVTTQGGGGVSVATPGNRAGNTVGSLGTNVDVQGVSVVNGRVYIDNKEIPPNVTRYKSPRTGEVYIIKRKGTAVEVTTE